MRRVLLVLSALACVGATQARGGPLVLDVHISDDVQRFHIVDQLSLWSPYCHRQYERWARPLLTEEEEALLHAHARVRAGHGWGSGLDAAFYVDGTPDLRRAGLTPEEAATEMRVLEGLARRIQPLLDSARPLLLSTRDRLATDLPRHSRTIRAIARLTGGHGRVRIPLFLVANPDAHSFGGGAYGEVLVVEVPSDADILPTVLHESFHVLLRPRATEIERAARLCGLDSETAGEGLAYALAPGIVHAGVGDPLADAVERLRASRAPVEDPYARFQRLALALRDDLAGALAARANFGSLLPQVCTAWREVQAETWP